LEWQCFLEQLTWTPRLRKKTLLNPRKFQTSTPEGSTTTSIAIQSAQGISSTTAASQSNRCCSNEDELKVESTEISHDLKLRGPNLQNGNQQHITKTITGSTPINNKPRNSNEEKQKLFVRQIKHCLICVDDLEVK
jgi:hypothetical protein